MRLHHLHEDMEELPPQELLQPHIASEECWDIAQGMLKDPNLDPYNLTYQEGVLYGYRKRPCGICGKCIYLTVYLLTSTILV